MGGGVRVKIPRKNVILASVLKWNENSNLPHTWNCLLDLSTREAKEEVGGDTADAAQRLQKQDMRGQD